jgi:predicted alpha/beta hydrolase family esterase
MKSSDQSILQLCSIYLTLTSLKTNSDWIIVAQSMEFLTVLKFVEKTEKTVKTILFGVRRSSGTIVRTFCSRRTDKLRSIDSIKFVMIDRIKMNVTCDEK